VSFLNLSDDTSLPETFPSEKITANFFDLIGQKPVIGRSFTADDEKPGAALSIARAMTMPPTHGAEIALA
jgi:hypothetical protein